MKIGKFELVNSEKVDRAINGTVTRGGEATGGVGQDASEAEILAAYDKLAGLVMVGKRKVKTGSFWNFEENRAHEEARVVYEVRGIDGKVYEIAEGEDVPLEVLAAEQDGKAPKGKKSSKKKSIEDEDDEEADDSDEESSEEESEVEVQEKPVKPSKTSKGKKSKKSVEDEE